MTSVLLAVTEGSHAWYEDHLPYYVFAGLTALWALSIGFIGIKSSKLPATEGLYKVMALITIILVGGTIGFAIGTGETPQLNQTRPTIQLGVVPQPGDAPASTSPAAP
jgi:hypothetical protein